MEGHRQCVVVTGTHIVGALKWVHVCVCAAGGGGRGMRLVTKQEDVLPMFKQAQQEAEAAFGNGATYIER